jgi:SAM-dependent methyltransferase
MVWSRQDAAARYSASAEAYAATMAPSLRSVAAEVVRRAALRPGERVLDAGTGTGIAAAGAVGDGREVVGVDAAEGMLAIAQREVPDVRFVQADFGAMPFAEATFDVVLAAHAILFGADRVAVLRELRRVARDGGRLSISVPGPRATTMAPLYEPIYRSFGLEPSRDYPTADELAGWATDAGWQEPATAADPATAIVLQDAAAYQTWLRVGSGGSATRDWPPERRAALEAALRDATPRDGGGAFRLPFGTLYLTARR